jgi:hypothetical protein
MKKMILIIALILSTITFGQNTKSEYLTINVKYGLKTTGITNEVSVDIGKSGQHSLSGELTNDDGVVTIENREYKSVIDVLNYFGDKGWDIYEVRTIKILNNEYYQYLLIKKSE